ncbi:hypothetical protein ACH4SK_17160 [Streptomyces inhibens]|uniref:hypothetical protein n=1 Tax=Streptomyces inhibens TaxID=2293571 RepID=UPI00379383FC
MRRHPWLPTLVITRPTLGPNGIDLLEHLLDVLADHPAEPARRHLSRRPPTSSPPYSPAP